MICNSDAVSCFSCGQRICARMKALLAEKKKKEEELEQVLMKKKLLADQVVRTRPVSRLSFARARSVSRTFGRSNFQRSSLSTALQDPANVLLDRQEPEPVPRLRCLCTLSRSTLAGHWQAELRKKEHPKPFALCVFSCTRRHCHGVVNKACPRAGKHPSLRFQVFDSAR
eukprot:1328870-Rhodomonas_salina.1